MRVSGAAQVIAVLDANVLYPAPLRDYFMWQAASGVFAARWTDEIHEEWIENLLIDRPKLSRERLQRTRELMDRHVDGVPVTGYARHIGNLELPDPNDRHVLAAAIECDASYIVTENLNDFPIPRIASTGRPHRDRREAGGPSVAASTSDSRPEPAALIPNVKDVHRLRVNLHRNCPE